MNKQTRLVLIGSGVAAGVGAARVLHRALTRYFVNVALDREAPPHPGAAEQRLSGFTETEEMAQALSDAAKKLADRPEKRAELQAADGTMLVGHWQECENPKRVIVAMHGWRSSWCHDFGLIADFWRENGCSVLYAEQRGQGSSGGAYMSFGLLERFDARDWAWWAAEQTGLPVYLAGISMGASTVLMAAGTQLPGLVRGIMADCGYTSPLEIWKHVAENNLKVSYGIYGPAANAICREKLQLSIDDYSCPDALSACTVPVLFIHGSDDHFVPVEMTYENYKACAAPKSLLIVPGAEHGMSYRVDREGYEAAVKEFWQKNDQ